mmetsp:Transcript_40080/g.87533  ORF Transcript_40080/g.87533 Transcript_40080/m.87533 type:complete len:227 (+) Transcript_40080:1870-2550(+)
MVSRILHFEVVIVALHPHADLKTRQEVHLRIGLPPSSVDDPLDFQLNRHTGGKVLHNIPSGVQQDCPGSLPVSTGMVVIAEPVRWHLHVAVAMLEVHLDRLRLRQEFVCWYGELVHHLVVVCQLTLLISSRYTDVASTIPAPRHIHVRTRVGELVFYAKRPVSQLVIIAAIDHLLEANGVHGHDHIGLNSHSARVLHLIEEVDEAEQEHSHKEDVVQDVEPRIVDL